MPLPARPAELLRRANQIIGALYSGNDNGGLTLPQFTVLDLLLRAGPQTAKQISATTWIDKSTMALMASRLAEDGFIVGLRVDTGGMGPKPLQLSLTPKGRKAVETAQTRLARAEVTALKVLKEHQRTALLKALTVMAFEARP